MKRWNSDLVMGVALLVVLVIATMVFIPVSKTADFSQPPGSVKPAGSSPFRDTRWPELMPQGWDPESQVNALRQGVHILADDSPQAMDRLQKMHDIWDNAPVNSALIGQSVRIPGYVVPLEVSIYGIKEFLLVPYFGACIHTPPPPSNQIIHVWSEKQRKSLRSMDTVWVSGTLTAERSQSDMGQSSYRLDAKDVQPYEEAK